VAAGIEQLVATWDAVADIMWAPALSGGEWPLDPITLSTGPAAPEQREAPEEVRVLLVGYGRQKLLGGL